MSVVLVDLLGFLALLVPLLWLTQVKGRSGGWAVAGASLWLVGGLSGALLAARLGMDPLPVGVVGRVVGATFGFLVVWSRPDDLPTRSVAGRREVCVYRVPGPLDPDAIAAFLTGEGLRATAEPWAVWVDAADAPAARRLLPGFVAPRRVHRASSVADAHLVADWLRRNGLDVQIRGDDRGGATGGIPVPDSFPEVWVRGADHERAAALVAQLDAVEDGPTWRCPRCAEDNPPAFASCWSCGGARKG